MKVIVFGASGGTGVAVLRTLTADGHDVTAFARNPAALPDIDGLRRVQGDVMRPDAVAASMPGQDAAVVILGNSQNPFALKLGARRTTPIDVCEVGTRHVIAAMRAASVARLIVVTAFGVGSTRAQLPLAFRLFYRLVLREHMADKEKQEALVKASGLDWTLVQPVGLTDAAATGGWLANSGGTIRKLQVSRADLAAFLARIVGDGSRAREIVAFSG